MVDLRSRLLLLRFYYHAHGYGATIRYGLHTPDALLIYRTVQRIWLHIRPLRCGWTALPRLRLLPVAIPTRWFPFYALRCWYGSVASTIWLRRPYGCRSPRCYVRLVGSRLVTFTRCVTLNLYIYVYDLWLGLYLYITTFIAGPLRWPRCRLQLPVTIYSCVPYALLPLAPFPVGWTPFDYVGRYTTPHVCCIVACDSASEFICV